MKPDRRRQTAEETLAGYVSGPEAAFAATEQALQRITASVHALILVEGISDQIAIETLANRLGHRLDTEGVVVLPVGGAHGVGEYLRRFGPRGSGLRLAGLCDAAEQPVYRSALNRTGLGPVVTNEDLEAAGFFVCDEDLEDELIRAVGEKTILDVLDAGGDIGSFRRMQRQPAWRDRPFPAQMRRFIGAGARRKSRYARLLTEAAEISRVPQPLLAVLDAI